MQTNKQTNWYLINSEFLTEMSEVRFLDSMPGEGLLSDSLMVTFESKYPVIVKRESNSL